MKLDGKIALITGAGSGIGRAIAILFAKEGAKVSIVDIDSSGGQETVKMIKQNGGTAEFVNADVTKTSDVKQAIRTTINAYTRLDILLNNAGTVHRFTLIEEIDEELWDKILAVNMKGIFLGCKYAVPIMKKQGEGIIINIASIAGVSPRLGMSAYAASKGGAIVLTKALAIELARYNVRVNCISPAVTDTPMFHKLAGDRDLEEVKKAFIANYPLGRLGKPKDIAYAALYLASDEASFITGINLEVDGGRRI